MPERDRESLRLLGARPGEEARRGYRFSGSISLLGCDIVLDAGTLDASGAISGGEVHVGQASSLPDTDTQTITVTPNSTLRADALSSSPGGQVALWSQQQTQFDGHVSG